MIIKSSKRPKITIFSWSTIEKLCVKFLVKNFFKPIRLINLTSSRPIWTRTGGKRYHWKKKKDDSTNLIQTKKKKGTIDSWIKWKIEFIMYNTRLYAFTCFSIKYKQSFFFLKSVIFVEENALESMEDDNMDFDFEAIASK